MLFKQNYDLKNKYVDLHFIRFANLFHEYCFNFVSDLLHILPGSLSTYFFRQRVQQDAHQQIVISSNEKCL